MAEEQFTHETFMSPFTWRYGSREMRAVWSEARKRRLLRRVWVALAEAQHAAGLVTAEQLADLNEHVDEIDLARSAQIEQDIHHDLMAELRTFAEQCPRGGPILHLGATSADILDNADALRIREAVRILSSRLGDVLAILAGRIEQTADLVCMGYTHLQPAEPTTAGYRLAGYGQDLSEDYHELHRAYRNLKGKGIKGAVGTAASFSQVLTGTGMTPSQLECLVMAKLDLEPFPITTQVYPRKQDARVLSVLGGIAASAYRLAFDVRLLQSPSIGEWSEPFSSHQVGSSAMPFKRNPINAENVDSLARFVIALVRVGWDNAAHSLLERTLDDSASRRLILPDAFLACDEILRRVHRILEGLIIHEEVAHRNVKTYGTFAASERLLMALVRNGADRQDMHERIRVHAMQAWQAVSSGQPNPLASQLADDPALLQHLPAERIRSLLDAAAYVGDAPERARQAARTIHELLSTTTW
jgi:adenylosuccinate lyase